MRKFLVCILLFLLLFFTVFPVRAAEVNFPQASEGQINEAMGKIVPLRILPSHPFYFLITGKEVIVRVFQPSSAGRTDYDLTLSGKRLKESYLLLLNGNLKGASAGLARYSRRMDKMVSGLYKARAQKQDVTALISEIAENLKSHETLFFAISKKSEAMDDKYNFGENYQKAAASFLDAVLAIDKFRPGVRDRFRSATESAKIEEDSAADSPISPGFIEASPSTKPSRIIY